MKKIIGRVEKVHFPHFELFDIDAKTDTGAYTSSIHCSNVEEVILEGKICIKFILMHKKHKNYTGKEFIFDKYKVKSVKSSNGIMQHRYAIKTKIQIFNKEYKIELTLSNRKKMRYPILIGRKFISKKFLVDPSLIYNATKLNLI